MRIHITDGPRVHVFGPATPSQALDLLDRLKVDRETQYVHIDPDVLDLVRSLTAGQIVWDRDVIDEGSWQYIPPVEVMDAIDADDNAPR